MTSDWQLLAKARREDDSAWQELWTRHSPRLYALCLLIVRDRQAAEDAVQETFIQLMDYGKPAGSLRALASTIAFRFALKERRRQARQIDLDSHESQSLDDSALDSMLVNERSRQVRRLLAALPEAQRDVLVLRFYGEQSYEEIARILSIPLGTVKSRIFEAVKRCRVLMKKEEFRL